MNNTKSKYKTLSTYNDVEKKPTYILCFTGKSRDKKENLESIIEEIKKFRTGTDEYESHDLHKIGSLYVNTSLIDVEDKLRHACEEVPQKEIYLEFSDKNGLYGFEVVLREKNQWCIGSYRFGDILPEQLKLMEKICGEVFLQALHTR